MPVSFTDAVKPVKERKRPGPKLTVNGRPCKRTPALDKALLAAISKGAPYKIACLACGISEDAFTDWRRKDPVFAQAVEKASGRMALRLLGKIEKQADENFSAAAWLLERRFVETFARPEVQLNLIQQNNTTVNALSITISPAEIRQIEAVAEPVRQSVKELYAAYRPNQGNGEGDASSSVSLSVQEKFAKYRPDQK